MNTLRSAQTQTEHLDFPAQDFDDDPRAALRQQVAERLAAHRSRRGRQAGPSLIPVGESRVRKAKSNPIAAAVAERYAQTQSYRDFLAAEAERAIEEANATAQVAARSAKAIAAAQQQLLAELDHWNDPEVEYQNCLDAAKIEHEDASFQASSAVSESQPGHAGPQTTGSGLTVRLYEDAGVGQPELRLAGLYTQARSVEPHLDPEESSALDDEIEFRQTPVFAEPSAPLVSIPANLIEFPRQLVAPRKARPRIAEGPLREEGDTTSAFAQLRIFEVEAEQIATAPTLDGQPNLPVWSSIHLDTPPIAAPVTQEETMLVLPLQVAPLDLRLMAAAVDACILGATLLGAVCGFAQLVTVLPSAPIAAIAGAGVLLVLFILYHALFFTFSDATPGMRYARIGLCTFSDENPTRSQMRRRTWAVLLAACPLGLGFLWAWLDDDRLGWHDRISRMYQRSY